MEDNVKKDSVDEVSTEIEKQSYELKTLGDESHNSKEAGKGKILSILQVLFFVLQGLFATIITFNVVSIKKLSGVQLKDATGFFDSALKIIDYQEIYGILYLISLLILIFVILRGKKIGFNKGNVVFAGISFIVYSLLKGIMSLIVNPLNKTILNAQDKIYAANISVLTGKREAMETISYNPPSAGLILIFILVILSLIAAIYPFIMNIVSGNSMELLKSKGIIPASMFIEDAADNKSDRLNIIKEKYFNNEVAKKALLTSAILSLLLFIFFIIRKVIYVVKVSDFEIKETTFQSMNIAVDSNRLAFIFLGLLVLFTVIIFLKRNDYLFNEKNVLVMKLSALMTLIILPFHMLTHYGFLKNSREFLGALRSIDIVQAAKEMDKKGNPWSAVPDRILIYFTLVILMVALLVYLISLIYEVLNKELPVEKILPLKEDGSSIDFKAIKTNIKEKSAKDKVYIIKLLSPLLVLILLLGSYGIYKSVNNYIDISKYIVVKTEGFDGRGTAMIDVDFKKLEKEYMYKLPFGDYSDLISLVNGINIDKESQLKNGDVLKFKDYKEEPLKESKKRIKMTSKEYTVSNLKPIKILNPESAFILEYTGTNGDGSAVAKLNTEAISKILSMEQVDYLVGNNFGNYVALSRQYYLKNGDSITISLPEYINQNNLGIKFEPLTATFKVSGLKEQ